MIRLFGADKFLTALLSRYLVYMAGGVGTGKTSFAVAISGMLHEWGLVDATISNLPIAGRHPPRTRISEVDQSRIRVARSRRET